MTGCEVAQDRLDASTSFHAFKDAVFVEGGRRQPSRDPVAREIEGGAVRNRQGEHFGVQRIHIEIRAEEIRHAWIVVELATMCIASVSCLVYSSLADEAPEYP